MPEEGCTAGWKGFQPRLRLFPVNGQEAEGTKRIPGQAPPRQPPQASSSVATTHSNQRTTTARSWTGNRPAPTPRQAAKQSRAPKQPKTPQPPSSGPQHPDIAAVISELQRLTASLQKVLRPPNNNKESGQQFTSWNTPQSRHSRGRVHDSTPANMSRPIPTSNDWQPLTNTSNRERPSAPGPTKQHRAGGSSKTHWVGSKGGGRASPLTKPHPPPPGRNPASNSHHPQQSPSSAPPSERPAAQQRPPEPLATRPQRPSSSVSNHIPINY